jgi:hypothetical protein
MASVASVTAKRRIEASAVLLHQPWAALTIRIAGSLVTTAAAASEFNACHTPSRRGHIGLGSASRAEGKHIRAQPRIACRQSQYVPLPRRASDEADHSRAMLLPLTFAAAALRESNRGPRSVFVALAVTCVLILYRERFGYAFWIHPVIWTCCGYLIFTGANGNAPAPLETNRVVWSAVAVIVAFVEVFLAQLFAVR